MKLEQFDEQLTSIAQIVKDTFENVKMTLTMG